MTANDFALYLNNLSADRKPLLQQVSSVPVELYNPFNDIIQSQLDELKNIKLPHIEIPIADELEVQRSAAKEIKSSRVKNSVVKAELGEEFLDKVKQIAKRLNCDYKDLLALMNSSVDSIMNMSAIEQLDYVEKYLQKAKKIRFGSSEKLDAGELYALTYLPARANRSVLATSNEKYYKWNKGLDLNKDGKITKDELAQRVERKQVNDMYFA